MKERSRSEIKSRFGSCGWKKMMNENEMRYDYFFFKKNDYFFFKKNDLKKKKK